MNYGTCSTNLKNNFFVRSGDAAKWIETYRDRIETKLNSKETKFVVDADNANYPPSISGIQNGIIAYAINQTEWSHDNTKIQLTAIGNATGFEFETTYEEQNNVSITGWQYIGGKWYYYEELGILSLFFELDRKDLLKEFSNQVLGGLIDYDKKHKGELLKTVEVYLNYNCPTIKTSEKLSTHRNTIKYIGVFCFKNINKT